MNFNTHIVENLFSKSFVLLFISNGYIPIDLSDPGYCAEIKREKRMEMPLCRCSNCDPQGAARLIRMLPETSVSQLDTLLTSQPTSMEDTSLFKLPKISKTRQFSGHLPLICKPDDPIRTSLPAFHLADCLVEKSNQLFVQTYPTGCDMNCLTLFSLEEAWSIVKNANAVGNGSFLRAILGGETLPGLFKMVVICISDCYLSDVYLEHEHALEDKQVRDDQEVLNQELLVEEHVEELQRKKKVKDEKKKQIKERKELRKNKAEEKLRIAHKKRTNRHLRLNGQVSTINVVNYTSKFSVSGSSGSFKLTLRSLIEPQVNREVSCIWASTFRIDLSLRIPSNSISSTSLLSSKFCVLFEMVVSHICTCAMFRNTFSDLGDIGCGVF